MAQRIAAEVDANRFGVRAFYLFGSTKNATAGPKSDIDVLVHFSGTPEARRALEAWLDAGLARPDRADDRVDWDTGAVLGTGVGGAILRW